MDAANYDGEKIKKKSKWKRNLFIVFVLLPLGLVAGLYFNNKNFKSRVNKALSSLPGSAGEYFKNYPTEHEREAKIKYLASYYSGLDSDVAADKIYIVKKDDENLYVDLIREMNAISSPKTEEVVLKVRNLELRKDLLYSIYETAKEEEHDDYIAQVARIDRQDPLTNLREMERSYSDESFVKILQGVKDEKLAEALYYADSDLKFQVLDKLDRNKKTRVDRLIFDKEVENNKLIDIARLYDTKPVDEAIEAIGSSDNYSIDKLATIYRNMSVLASAKVLSEIEDDKFVEELFEAIILQEKLSKKDLSITKDISQAMEFLTDYKFKINEMVLVFEKMNPSNVAKLAEEMMDRDNVITLLELSSYEKYELSDSVIIVDIFQDMKKQTLAKVFDSMDTKKAAKMTQLLSKPKENILFEGGEKDGD